MSDDARRFMWKFDIGDSVFCSVGELGHFSITQLEHNTQICIMPPNGKKGQFYYDGAAKDAVARIFGDCSQPINYSYVVGEENEALSKIIMGRVNYE